MGQPAGTPRPLPAVPRMAVRLLDRFMPELAMDFVYFSLFFFWGVLLSYDIVIELLFVIFCDLILFASSNLF